MVAMMEQILAGEANVEAFRKPLSLYFGPSEILVNLDVNFQDDLSSDDIEQTIDRIEMQIKAAMPAVNRIFIEAETLRKAAHSSGEPRRRGD